MFLTAIPRRSRKCCLGQEILTAGTPYYSRLKTLKEGEYEREDFCLSCWSNELSVPSAVSWKGEVPKKSVSELALDKKEDWIDSLREALEGKEEDDRKEAFLMALFLKRKKILKECGELKGNLLFEVIETEEMLMIPKVAIKPEDIRLQERVLKKL